MPCGFVAGLRWILPEKVMEDLRWSSWRGGVGVQRLGEGDSDVSAWSLSKIQRVFCPVTHGNSCCWVTSWCLAVDSCYPHGDCLPLSPGKASALSLSCWRVSNSREILHSAHSALMSVFTHIGPSVSCSRTRAWTWCPLHVAVTNGPGRSSGGHKRCLKPS